MTNKGLILLMLLKALLLIEEISPLIKKLSFLYLLYNEELFFEMSNCD